MKKFEVKIFPKGINANARIDQVEARNMDSAVNKAFKLCKKGETAFVTKELI